MIRTENLTILFVDIAGFTVTTSRQSRVENARLLQTFGSTLLPLIKHYKGRLIKTIGDALLITFRSPTDAMLCSMALQDAMHAHNLSAPEGEKIHIRVAANLGEVRVTKNDIFGEPVNVASRIEGVAPADEIYLSEAVYMAMNKAEVPVKEVGFKELAGVAQAVRLYNIPRFSTPRLVAENINLDEQGNELIYPYGGMHCQTHPRNFKSFLKLSDNKKPLRYLIPALALCAVAIGVIAAYQALNKKPAETPASVQTVKNETQAPAAETTEMKQQPITAEPSTTGNISGTEPETKAQSSPINTETTKTIKSKTTEKGSTKTGAESAKTDSSVRKAPAETPVSKTVAAPAEKTKAEENNTDLSEAEPETTEEEIADSKPARTSGTEKIDSSAWNVTKAKQDYRANKISKAEYSKIVRKLKTDYERKIRQLRADLSSGKITRAEYQQEANKAKHEYAGR